MKTSLAVPKQDQELPFLVAPRYHMQREQHKIRTSLLPRNDACLQAVLLSNSPEYR
jgi:hypothetical protein